MSVKEMNNIELYDRLKFVNGMINRPCGVGENKEVYNRQMTEYMIQRHELNTEIEHRGFLPLW